MPASISSSDETLGGKEPGLTLRQQAELVRMDGTIAGLMEVFSIGRAAVYQSSNAPAPPVEPGHDRAGITGQVLT